MNRRMDTVWIVRRGLQSQVDNTTRKFTDRYFEIQERCIRVLVLIGQLLNCIAEFRQFIDETIDTIVAHDTGVGSLWNSTKCIPSFSVTTSFRSLNFFGWFPSLRASVVFAESSLA